MISKQMHIYKDYLTMLTKNQVHSILCYSKAGLGKTYTTIKILKKLKEKYSYVSGITTTMALYKELYDTNGEILIIDDIETMFKDDKTINILKSALWEVDGKRIISYKTTSKTLGDYPNTFEYTGKIVILANELKGKKDESFKALMSRCLKFELKYTLQEIKKMSEDIINQKNDLTKEQKEKIIHIMKEEISSYHSFNFRLLERLIQFVKYDTNKAKKLFINSLETDEEGKTLLKIIKENKDVEMQINEYKKQTNKSRMSYYRKKKQLKQEGLI